MKNKIVGITITGSGNISAIVDSKSFTVNKSHQNYDKIINAIIIKDFDLMVDLIDLVSTVKSYVAESNRVNIVDGAITFDGVVIHNSLTDRILQFINEGLPVEPLIKFFENLMENPSFRAVNELYKFLEVGSLPLTEDGFFLAYKNVRSNFTDIYTGTFDNSIGKVCKMPRNMVNEDSNQTCSDGLHVCSLAYLPNFSNADGHTVIVKVNPKDVVSVPIDYSNTKLRCCEYEVIAECFEDWKQKIADGEKVLDKPLYSSNGGEYGIKPSGQKFYNVRNEKGHFVKRGTESEDNCDGCFGCDCGCGDED